MKPIYECLDIMLHQLQVNYDIDPLPKLNVDDLLTQFEVPIKRHEFFKGILNMLIDDGCADFLDYHPDRKALSLDTYKNRIILLPKGFELIQDGGYTTAYEKAQCQKKIQNLKDWLLVAGTVLAGLAGVALLFWEYYKKVYS